jgi:hypothetical protein
MRRLLTWLGVVAGAVAVVRWRLRRHPSVEPTADPAAELKQKLAESRTDGPPAEPEPAAEPAPEPPQATLDERRRDIHDRARAAIDDMLGGDRLPGEEVE